MTPRSVCDVVLASLDDLKGRDVVALDVSRVTDVADYMVIAGGTSTTHVRALVDRVVEDAKRAGLRVFGVEGRDVREWVLVDLGDVVVHVMGADARDFYDLERLWDVAETNRVGSPTRP